MQVEIKDGEAVTTNQMSAGGLVTSNDYQSEGVKVSRGMGSVHVTDASQLADGDLVTIDGIEVTAKLAKELGIIDQVFAPIRSPAELDKPLSLGAAANAAQQAAPEVDPVTAGLDAAVEAGDMTTQEANIHSTAVGELALAGFDVDQGVALIEQVAKGETSDMTADQQQVATAVEAMVTQAATTAAQAELGQTAFTYLQRTAVSSPDVAEAVRGYAIQRATGRTEGATWSDLYADIVAHMSGGTE